MEEIMTLYKKYKGIKPLFSDYIIFDWYDGALSGIGKLNDTDNYYLFNIVSWDTDSSLRIFSVLRVESSRQDKFQTIPDDSKPDVFSKLINDYFQFYSGDVYLFKAKNIDDLEYTLIKSKKSNLALYNTIEEIANQSVDIKNRWFNLFLPS